MNQQTGRLNRQVETDYTGGERGSKPEVNRGQTGDTSDGKQITDRK